MFLEIIKKLTRVIPVPSEIIPARCNNCVLFFANVLLYMFRMTVPPIIRSTCAVYGHR